ncbi:MAG: PPOX class F420-dependent oxidoreductase [Acidimicrobiales bacterium]|nr:PPOX class F420-dependent oxidoreductase [Acidimicrobiales bacterium]MYH75209.1 PPOX class F420-dependent oxidoreductase [Acidimicrobiales bacterium]MYK71126.1 PPOX class F420-dependent oxidoreductase [Acidimicrobiales bacterium]
MRCEGDATTRSTHDQGISRRSICRRACCVYVSCISASAWQLESPATTSNCCSSRDVGADGHSDSPIARWCEGFWRSLYLRFAKTSQAGQAGLDQRETGASMTASAASEPAVLSDDAQELLRRPNFAHLATVRTDGTSSIAPVWIDPVDASTVIVSTGDGSHKVANLRRDPRVVISVVDFDNPYEELQLRGVAEIEPDPDMVVLDALSHKYTNQPFRVRFEGCVTLRITITSYRHTVHAEEHTPADR